MSYKLLYALHIHIQYLFHILKLYYKKYEHENVIFSYLT